MLKILMVPVKLGVLVLAFWGFTQVTWNDKKLGTYMQEKISPHIPVTQEEFTSAFNKLIPPMDQGIQQIRQGITHRVSQN